MNKTYKKENTNRTSVVKFYEKSITCNEELKIKYEYKKR